MGQAEAHESSADLGYRNASRKIDSTQTPVSPSERKDVLLSLSSIPSGAFSELGSKFSTPDRVSKLGFPVGHNLTVLGERGSGNVVTVDRDGAQHVWQLGSTLKELPTVSVRHDPVSRDFAYDGKKMLYVVGNDQNKKPPNVEILSHIASAAYSAQLGRPVTKADSHEIYEYVNTVKRANPGKNFDRLKQGELLTLPITVDRAGEKLTSLLKTNESIPDEQTRMATQSGKEKSPETRQRAFPRLLVSQTCLVWTALNRQPKSVCGQAPSPPRHQKENRSLNHHRKSSMRVTAKPQPVKPRVLGKFSKEQSLRAKPSSLRRTN